MAWPKLFGEIKAQLDRIEAKLDAALPKPLPAPPPPGPEEEAAAFAAQIDYDSYAVSELAARSGGLTPQQRAMLRTYEASHKARKGALAALEEPS
jgi:hypothetical protein